MAETGACATRVRHLQMHGRDFERTRFAQTISAISRAVEPESRSRRSTARRRPSRRMRRKRCIGSVRAQRRARPWIASRGDRRLEGFLTSAAKAARGGEAALRDRRPRRRHGVRNGFRCRRRPMRFRAWRSPAYSHKMPNGFSRPAVPQIAGAGNIAAGRRTGNARMRRRPRGRGDWEEERSAPAISWSSEPALPVAFWPTG